MSVCVYYSLDHLLSRHGGGCSQKWELQCLNGYIIPLLTYFPDMERVAHRNENCNVCICIFFLWSPFLPTWRELLIEMRVAMSENVYYSFDHIFSPTWRGLLTEMRIAMSARVYYSLDHLFPQHGRGFSQKWELQCLHVYIIPLINLCPQHGRGFSQKWEFVMSVCVYSSLDHAFPKHGVGCWEKWELQCLYVYIIPLIAYFQT